jgi:CRP/FNR family cyclic AMP-dependent transcriptional regulator
MRIVHHKQYIGNQPVERLLAQCHIRHYPPKTLVIHAGDTANSLFFIAEGSVAVGIDDENGSEIVLSYLNRGEFFGEIGLFQDDPTRSAWVRTRTDCQIGELSYSRFRQLTHNNPDLLLELTGQIAARLTRTTRKVGDLAFLNVAGRIARTLLDLCHQPDAITHPGGIQIRISRQELGRIVGCSREMAGRVLKSLEEQGLITASGQRVVVFDVNRESANAAGLTASLSFK